VSVLGRNVVLCSDGTGNKPASDTNAFRLTGCLQLGDNEKQVACYAPGLGTVASPGDEAALRRAAAAGLRMLPAAGVHRLRPIGTVQRLAGLGFGSGLKGNVRQLYAQLAEWYEGEDDRVFLFGYSRGAFTVRALAGLLHRCRLTSAREPDDVRAAFERAWAAFEPMRPDDTLVRAAREDTRECSVHFLGLWDTVKSYGGFLPVMLPHLRHNPAVRNVAHALALDEQRAWFKPTTWGRLDEDEKGALTRVPPNDLARIRQRQEISEVWFTGAHGDIGGGDITLRWMLRHATRVEPGLLLSASGTSFMNGADPEPGVHFGWRRWAAVEQLPRLEIHNDGEWPVRRYHRGSDGRRNPDVAARAGRVTVHRSVDPARISHLRTPTAVSDL
jgi:uncharacterized protein (DUF2235 family)